VDSQNLLLAMFGVWLSGKNLALAQRPFDLRAAQRTFLHL